jgi:hypothetical protein
MVSRCRCDRSSSSSPAASGSTAPAPVSSSGPLAVPSSGDAAPAPMAMVVHPRIVQGDLRVVSMSGPDSALGSRVSESGSDSTASGSPHLVLGGGNWLRGGEDQAALAPGPMVTRQHPTGRRHSEVAAEVAKLSPPAPAAGVGVGVGVGDSAAPRTWTGTDEAVGLGFAVTTAVSVAVDAESTVALRYPSPVEPQLSVSPSPTTGRPASRRRISSRARARAGSSARFESSASPPALGVELEHAAPLTGSRVMMGPGHEPTPAASDMATRLEEARPVSPSVALQSSLLDRSYV